MSDPHSDPQHQSVTSKVTATVSEGMQRGFWHFADRITSEIAEGIALGFSFAWFQRVLKRFGKTGAPEPVAATAEPRPELIREQDPEKLVAKADWTTYMDGVQLMDPGLRESWLKFEAKFKAEKRSFASMLLRIPVVCKGNGTEICQRLTRVVRYSPTYELRRFALYKEGLTDRMTELDYPAEKAKALEQAAKEKIRTIGLLTLRNFDWDKQRPGNSKFGRFARSISN